MIRYKLLSTFSETGGIFADLHLLGNLPKLRDILNSFGDERAMQGAASLSIRAVRPSGPQALLTFRLNKHLDSCKVMNIFNGKQTVRLVTILYKRWLR